MATAVSCAQNLSLPTTQKNSGKGPACGTCGGFGPSYHVVIAVVANPMGRDQPKFRCVHIRSLGSVGFFDQFD